MEAALFAALMPAVRVMQYVGVLGDNRGTSHVQGLYQKHIDVSLVVVPGFYDFCKSVNNAHVAYLDLRIEPARQKSVWK
jgi:hypothetical protein